jgi:Uma2 family endonuclease
MIDHNDPGEEVPPVTAEMLDYLSFPDRQVWTIDDLFVIPDDGHRYEIFDGSLIMSAAATSAHQVAGNRLVRILERSAPHGIAAATEIAIDLGKHAPVPDVVVGPGSVIWDLDTRHLLPEQVMLAVEVVSPSSMSRDRVLKPAVYAQAGIPAYWLVDLHGADAPRVTMHELVDGVYRLARVVRAGEEVDVSVPFPLKLRPTDLVGPPRED